MTEYELLKTSDITFPRWILVERDLSPAARILLAEIYFCCEHHGSYSLSNDEIAQLYQVTSITASLWVCELVNKGYVRREIDKRPKRPKRILYAIKKGE